MVRYLGPVAVVVSSVALSCAPGAPAHPALRTGRDVYGDNCSSCHGDAGQGGVGPSLENVLYTWRSCADHKEWIALGTAGWKQVHGPTYGAEDREITKDMPSHADKLSPDEIAAVAAYERVEYGGGQAEAVLADCGIAED